MLFAYRYNIIKFLGYGKAKKVSDEFHNRVKEPATIFIQLNSKGMIHVRKVNNATPVYAKVGQFKQAVHIEPGNGTLSAKFMKQTMSFGKETGFNELEIFTEPNEKYNLEYDFKNNEFVFKQMQQGR